VAERKGLKRLFAALGLVGTAASIWWFALKPRRSARGSTESKTD
jgi:hypothetical protein